MAVVVAAAPVAREALKGALKLVVAASAAAAAAMLTTAVAWVGAVVLAMALYNAFAVIVLTLLAVMYSVLVTRPRTAKALQDAATAVATSARDVLNKTSRVGGYANLFMAALVGVKNTALPAGTARDARKMVLALKTAGHVRHV